MCDKSNKYALNNQISKNWEPLGMKICGSFIKKTDNLVSFNDH